MCLLQKPRKLQSFPLCRGLLFGAHRAAAAKGKGASAAEVAALHGGNSLLWPTAL